MSFTIDKKLGRNIKRYNVYTKEELDSIFGGNIVKAGEDVGRQAELSENLDELDENLDSLDGRINTLNDFLNDPESLPEGADYITQLLVDDVWAGSVTALEGWFEKVTANDFFVDKLVANDVFANVAVLNQLFAQEITMQSGGIIKNSGTDYSITDDGMTFKAIDPSIVGENPAAIMFVGPTNDLIGTVKGGYEQVAVGGGDIETRYSVNVNVQDSDRSSVNVSVTDRINLNTNLLNYNGTEVATLDDIGGGGDLAQTDRDEDWGSNTITAQDFILS